MMGQQLALRPRGLPEIADLALVTIRRHSRAFLMLSPWVIVPAVLCWAAVVFAGADDGVMNVVSSCLLAVTSGVYTVLCGDLAIYERVDVRDVQRRFVRELPRLVVAAVVSAFVAVFTLYLGYGRLVFQTEAMLLERQAVVPSLGRSAALVRATPGRALMLLVLFLGVVTWGSFAVVLLDRSVRELIGVGGGDGPFFGDGQIAWYVGEAFITPFWVTLRFLAYLDCRTRREGWDLQMRVAGHVAASEARTAVGRQEAA